MIDASIPLQVRPPQIEEPTNALMRALQMGHLMDQRQQTQKTLADESALNAAYAQALGPDGKVDRNKLFTVLAGSNQGRNIPTIQKQLLEADDKEADVGKKRMETTKDSTEVENRTIAMYRDASQSITDPQSAVEFVTHMHSDPRLANSAVARIPLQQALAQIPQDPAQLPAWKQQFALGAAKFMELNKPQFVTSNTGGQTVTTGVAGLTGQTMPVQTLQNTQSPDNAATNATHVQTANIAASASRDNAAATREVAQATRDAANIQTGFKNEQELRKEFEGLPEVKNYKQAYPAYAAIKDAASRNTTQSDINIVYGLAKLYDPNSVVREGEYATVANSPNIPERVKGYAQYLQGGGKLSPETKQAILAEAQGRIGTYEAEARKAKGSYEQIAKTRGMNPGAVFADMGDMTAGAPTPVAAGGGGLASAIDAELARRAKATPGRK